MECYTPRFETHWYVHAVNYHLGPVRMYPDTSWIRNFLFADSPSVLTYPTIPVCESATFWTRLTEWKFYTPTAANFIACEPWRIQSLVSDMLDIDNFVRQSLRSAQLAIAVGDILNKFLQSLPSAYKIASCVSGLRFRIHVDGRIRTFFNPMM